MVLTEDPKPELQLNHTDSGLLFSLFFHLKHIHTVDDILWSCSIFQKLSLKIYIQKGVAELQATPRL